MVILACSADQRLSVARSEALDTDSKIVISGGAGLVGQNLVVALLDKGYSHLTVIDKSHHNLQILRSLHQQVAAVEADLSVPGNWQQCVAEADILVILHAQIGGLSESEFTRNNVQATDHLLNALGEQQSCYLLHVSSSVVNSQADDYYTRSKLAQEDMVRASAHPWFILRPTLMFGWFDRKHFGWLSRFMRKMPVFPIPGSGDYLRQPLYAGDFCSILVACIQQRPTNEGVNISGKEKVPYLEIIRKIRAAIRSRTPLVHIPVWLFGLLLKVYALFDRDPPFTTTQLEALVIDELFEDNDWEGRFGIEATPLQEALEQTFRHPLYSDVVLEF